MPSTHSLDSLEGRLPITWGLSNKERWRETACCLSPSLPLSLLPALLVCPEHSHATSHIASLLSSNSSSQTWCWSQQPRLGNLKEKRGWTRPLTTCPSAYPGNLQCCWLAAFTRGKVLIPHGWNDGEEIQSAAEAEADQLSPCYSHGNT